MSQTAGLGKRRQMCLDTVIVRLPPERGSKEPRCFPLRGTRLIGALREDARSAPLLEL
jgi:hypothetical protein